jgi:PEP-CTERM motif
MKKLALLVVLVFSFALASYATPLPTLGLTETFQSGATFNGTVTFLSDYSNLVAVSGVLSGGSWATQSINWIWDQTVNYASSFGPQYGGNFLMSGTTCGNECGSYQDFITITWDFSSAPNIVLASPGGSLAVEGGNNVDYVDPLVSGHFAPEPGTLVMFGSGVIGLAGLIRRKLSV